LPSALDHFKAGAIIPDMMADPVWSASDDVKDAPLARAYGIDGNFWDFLAAPGNEIRQGRFSDAMAAYTRFFPEGLINQGGQTPPARLEHGLTGNGFAGFPWHSLPKDSIIVDVAGGVGQACQLILGKNPHLKFIVQDLPQTIADGRQVLRLSPPYRVMLKAI
jgi:hypothetical protein